MIRTGPYGFLLANWDNTCCFPVVDYIPEGTPREHSWAKKNGMPPLGTYRATGLLPDRAMYISSMSWFDRAKRYLDTWPVEHFYSHGTDGFTFCMRVDGKR